MALNSSMQSDANANVNFCCVDGNINRDDDDARHGDDTFRVCV